MTYLDHPVPDHGQRTISAPSARKSWAGPNAYTGAITTGEMLPAIKPQWLLCFDPDQPLKLNQDVRVVFCDGTEMIRRLVGKTAKSVTLRQYSPPKDTVVPKASIQFMHMMTAWVYPRT